MATGNGQFTRDGKLVQVCPHCEAEIECNDNTLAAFIQKYGCSDCRWKETEPASAVAVASKQGGACL